MKRFLPILTLIACMGVAYAADYVNVAVYDTAVTPAAPNTSTAGVSLTGPKGSLPSGIAVTITDYSDGGDDDHYAAVVAANAWVYNPEMRKPDGGGGWTRWPLGDVSTTVTGADIAFANTSLVSQGFTVTLPSAGVAGLIALGGAGQRLYYQPDLYTNIDGGSNLKIRTSIKVRFPNVQ